jgi:hypothetical protein
VSTEGMAEGVAETRAALRAGLRRVRRVARVKSSHVKSMYERAQRRSK